MPEINDFNAIRISLASPDDINGWSRGEVTKPETINYRTLKPERDGLFCEKIFGPQKDWECYCGKYKRVRYKGVVCDKCGVEVTRSKVRRERMGHIQLASPVSHIWFVKGTPSRLGLLLDISPRNLERVLYFASYIVVDVDEEDLGNVREHLRADYQVRRAEIEGKARGRGEDASTRISQELAQMAQALESTTKEIKARFAEQISELEDEAQELRDQLEQLQGRAAPEDLEYRGRTLAEKAEPLGEYHLNRLDELLEEETDKRKAQREQELSDADSLTGAERDQRTYAAEQSQTKLDDELQTQMDALNKEEKERLDRLDEIKLLRIISESEYRILRDLAPTSFRAEMGAGAVRDLVGRVDLDTLAEQLQEEMQISAATSQKRKKATKRLRVVEAFRKSGNKPEWMILKVLPVIPPDLRPMVQLDGGRFATSDLNDLYRRVINRNNRLKRLMELNAPEIIVRNEKRMLQEAVDALIDNGRRGRAVSGKGKHRLKSLSDMLKGKQGRFRQNLLGKRVDYSGRSVIVVGPTLELHQCGLPKKMALELFKPFVMRRLVEKGHAHNIKAAKRFVERIKPEVWDALEEVIQDYLVLLNRAPSLHRLSIQAFEAKLIEGSAIQLHPLVCAAFNADFDGDQMAVHVPLSRKAQEEARTRMLSRYNLLSPATGDPIITPAQDIVLGCFYLTQVNHSKQGTGKAFAGIDEALLAYNNRDVHIQAPIKVVLNEYIVGKQMDVEMEPKQLAMLDGRPRVLVETTVGRLIFNNALRFPDEPQPGEELSDGSIFMSELHFRNQRIDKKGLGRVIADCYSFYSRAERLTPEVREQMEQRFGELPDEELLRYYASEQTAKLADRIKSLGFKHSTLGGMTFSAADVEIPAKKKEIMAQADDKVRTIERNFRRGLITSEERYREIVETWDTATEEIKLAVQETMNEFGPISMMSTSGARGNIGQIRQMAGMRGLMADPNGRIIETPIRSSFREGLSVLEYFISTHGGRKGLADTALRTADAGYLTRRLVDVAQDVIVLMDDCGTEQGQWVLETDREEVRLGMRERIIGRMAAADVFHPATGELIVERNHEINEKLAQDIADTGVDRVYIRTPLLCRASHGVCRQCYGRNLATGQLVGIGEAVGIIAAQSIGEPGTQLTLRTFHTGGVAAAEDITQGLPRIQEIFEARSPKNKAVIAEIDGLVRIERTEDTRTIVIEAEPAQPSVQALPDKYSVLVKDGDEVKAGDVLAESNRSDTDDAPIKARTSGIVRVGSSEITVQPLQTVEDRRSYVLPHTARLRGGITDGARVSAGQQMTEGALDPQEMLTVMGREAVQTYLTNEAQKVYRDQGVPINDKHVEIIVRQMLRRVRIEDPGDTELLPSEVIDSVEFRSINEGILAQGGEPALGTTLLLGLIKASLTTDSFLSAASFQETTRVLTEAAITGKVDYLRGLKENVVIGKLIPAGTGLVQRRLLAAAANKRVDAFGGGGDGGATDLLEEIGGDGVTAGGDGTTRDQFAQLASETGTSVLDNLMLDALFNRESNNIEEAIDRLDTTREPEGVYSDPEPQDETDRGYFENAAPNDPAEARAEEDAARERDEE